MSKTSRLMTVGVLSLALSTSALAAVQAQAWSLPQGLYVGVFGGGGSVMDTNANQNGTAFFPAAPLSVNVSGNVHSNSTWFGGLHVGFGCKNPCWFVTPAVELEGFYLHSNLDGHVDSQTSALPEHNFDISLPTQTGVFLINNVYSFNIPCSQLHPYVGGGVGGALVTVSGSDSTQVSPPEPGVNHFNSRTGASAGAFAAQVKAGLRYTVCNNVDLFAEYRFLYLTPTNYTFGSTEVGGHAPTSPWAVNVDGLRYNLGAIGIEFSA